MKKLISTFLVINKLLLLLVFHGISFMSNTMASSAPCANEEIKKNSCEICFLTSEILSKPFVSQTKKENDLDIDKDLSPLSIIEHNFPGKFLVVKKISSKKLFHRSSYLFAKQKIVLII
jgi:hypothetical protein